MVVVVVETIDLYDTTIFFLLLKRPIISDHNKPHCPSQLSMSMYKIVDFAAPRIDKWDFKYVTSLMNFLLNSLLFF
jgi:hypothetical protein